VKKVKAGNGDSQVPNIIAQGTSITGDIKSNGDFRIDGLLVGTIVASGRIVIGETGEVQGDISCQNVDISGKVTGTVTIDELTMLKKTSRFEGKISTTRLAIESGAVFTGECFMGSVNYVDGSQKQK